MALLQPGDLFPNGTASIEFTSGSGTTITPFSQSGNAYVVFETDLINNPNEPTKSLSGATFTSLTASTGAVIDGAGYHAAIVTSPGSSFTFTPSVNIPAGRVLLRATGNIGLDVASFTGLLDTFTAAVGYSVRQLRADATSSLRVRRSSDDAEQDIGFNTSNELDTTALLAFVGTGGSDNGFVTIWYDQTGNGNDATNATETQQPLVVSAGALVTENGKAAVEFDGNPYALNFTELNLGDNSWFINAVYKSTRTTLEDYLLYGDSGQTRIRMYTTTARMYVSNVSYSFTIDSHRNTQQLFTFEADASKGLSVYQNGTEKGTEQTIATNDSFNPSSLGQAGSSRTIDGLVQEIIIFNSDQSANRTGIETNINTHFSIF